MAFAVKDNETGKITLVMHEDEADTLADVLANIGGSPRDTRRKYTDAILHALGGLGHYYSFTRTLADIEGAVVFHAPTFPQAAVA